MLAIACIVIYIFADLLFRSIIGNDCFMNVCFSKHSIWEVEYPIAFAIQFSLKHHPESLHVLVVAQGVVMYDPSPFLCFVQGNSSQADDDFVRA